MSEYRKEVNFYFEIDGYGLLTKGVFLEPGDRGESMDIGFDPWSIGEVHGEASLIKKENIWSWWGEEHAYKLFRNKDFKDKVLAFINNNEPPSGE